jgi:hypothetical protein
MDGGNNILWFTSKGISVAYMSDQEVNWQSEVDGWQNDFVASNILFEEGGHEKCMEISYWISP